MDKEFWTSAEIIEIFNVKAGFIAQLEEEEIICPTCRDDSAAPLFSTADLEKLRIAKILMEELEVNLPGVEVILRMRQNMMAMRRQFDDILEQMSRHIRKAMG
jgi:MerR family transcriptional regulator/heat shock protein HspR